ncbi:MAG: 5'/3'-nucleotidase SurE [Clostridia bacterium]|nr:5'/3'-nucleotidase SurE [Clostridia bacterium]MBO4428896.1 5'/3'-nucleotidase SurE [Clostridia bacterium]
MKILITNDDGMNGAGLRLLASWAKKLGDVLIVAPKEQQSACSHSIVLRRPIEVVKSDVFSDIGIEAYSVDATPADCVRYSVDVFGAPDLVFSGINHGMNVGDDVSYSGTCGAAFEANFYSVPAVAFSADIGCLDVAAKELDGIWDFFKENRLLDHADIYNVNVPKSQKGIRLTSHGGAFYRDHFVPCGNDMYEATLYSALHGGKLDESVDTDAVTLGYCSITPLTSDRTDRRAFEILKRN